MDDMTKKAFTEVNDIINHFEERLYNKIPKTVKDFIYENRDKDYIVNINYEKSLMTQKILQETNIILSLLYRDYICDEEKRNNLKLQDNKELFKFLENMENSFDKRLKVNNKKMRKHENSKSLINVKKDVWYNRIFKFIKSIFMK